MKIDLTYSQFDRMVDIMTDVLLDNLTKKEIGILQKNMELLYSLKTSDISAGDKVAYDLYCDIVDALNRDDFVELLVLSAIVEMSR